MKYRAYKWFIDFEKEEKWINEMAQIGMNFTDYSPFRYSFEKGTPGEYIYRIELLKERPSHPGSRVYIDFMEDNGVECVSTFYRWAYFRKKASEGPFDIYSDVDSRIIHYKRVAALAGAIAAANLIIAIINYLDWIFIGYHRGIHINVVTGSINLSFCIVLTFFLIPYLRKIIRLKREKQLYE